METRTAKPALPFHVSILLCEAFSNMLLACLLEPLRVVRDEQGGGIDWTVFTPFDAPVRSSSGLSLSPDRPLAGASPCDLLLVIGGDRFRTEARDPGLKRALRLVRGAGAVIAADTGSWLLAEAGYLDGRRATVHWQLLGEFVERFPGIAVQPDPYVIDGRWMTCGSASAALELVLQVIAERFGTTARFDAAAMFLTQPSGGTGTAPAFDGLLSHPDPRLRRVFSLMASHVDQPMTLAALAKASGLALRTMARLFEAEIGLSPGRVYTQMRLARARELLLQPGLTRDRVATLCGFSCAAALTRALKRIG